MKNPQPKVEINVSFANHEELIQDPHFRQFKETLQDTVDGVAHLFGVVLAHPEELLDLFRRFLRTFGEMCDEEINRVEEEALDED